VTGDNFEGACEVERGFALLAVEVEGAEFHITESAEEFEGGGLDSVLLSDFNERGVDIRISDEGAHEDAGARGINLFDGYCHGL
jgi:hypothetical protein